MPFPGNGENLKLGKGSMMIRLWDGSTPPGADDGFDFMGSMDSVTLSADVTTAEKFGNSERSGALLDRRVLRVAYSLAVAMSEFAVQNLKLFLLGEQASASQNVNANYEKHITGIELGKYYDYGARRMTGVEVYPGSGGSSPLTEGTDYEINTEFGMIRFLSGGAIQEGDDAFVNGAAPALSVTKLRLAQDSAPVGHIRFLCDDANNEAAGAKDLLDIPKVSIAPNGELNLISDEYGAFSLQMTILSDAAHNPTEPYGTLQRIAA